MKLTHGGARQGAGAKRKPNNILYQRRFDKSLVEKMDSYLTELKQSLKK